MNNPKLEEVGKATQFPVNRQDHTQKGPYLTSILKKLMAGTWEFNDPKIQDLLKRTDCKQTIETALVLRRILNGTEGDDQAIERIFDRIDGKVAQKTEMDLKGEIVMMPCVEKDGKPLDFDIGD
jgi:hypothetical protein